MAAAMETTYRVSVSAARLAAQRKRSVSDTVTNLTPRTDPQDAGLLSRTLV